MGSAEDPESGALPNSSLVWRVEKHHDTHFHPFLPETAGNNVPIDGPEPEELSAATNSYLELILTATDPQRALHHRHAQHLPGHRPDITFNSNPSGLDLEVAGTTVTTPETITSWKNWDLIVNAPNQFDSQNDFWRFSSWSDGGAATHTINTPSSPATYTATFSANQAPTACGIRHSGDRSRPARGRLRRHRLERPR